MTALRTETQPAAGQGRDPVAFLERLRSLGGLPGTLLFMLGLAVAYYVAARLSLNLALVEHQVTPIWPPTGIAVAGMLVFGRRMWPGITLAAFLVNAPISPSVWAAAGIALGNTLAPLLAVHLLARAGFRREMERLRDAIAIVFLGALLAMGVSATIGTTTLLLSGSIEASRFLSTWSVWWTGDAMGVLVVAPVLLSLRPMRPDPHVSGGRWFEAPALVVALMGLTTFLFLTDLPVQYLVFPGLAWAAWRYGQRGAAAAVLASSGIAIWAAAQGLGPFAEGGLLQKMVTLQVFNATAAFSSFFLAAIVAERRQHLAARRAAEEELRHQALHDPLTGLPNRTLFMDRLGQALARASRSRGTFAVLFLDLDRFKHVNDTMGHEAGDHVLRRMADRLQHVLRDVDTASRFGGDEFLLLCEELGRAEQAILIAARIGVAVSQPIELEGEEVVVTTSIGIALPGDRLGAEDLVRNADEALYRAKEKGRARFEVFEDPTR